MTRTFPVNGKFSKPQREIYDIVLAAGDPALELYRPGTSLYEVNQEVVRIMITGRVRLGILKGEIHELTAHNGHLASL
ncbi:M24 family metallopeptidase, partial [Klebsiella variicola]|uniref:M24 family metallopeptidase n=1 Tax=Klebsiella variicola TaxID=244366 RepID=UPI003F67FDCD